MLAVAEWSLTYALELGSTGLATKVFWLKVQYFGVVMMPTAWLCFAAQYTKRDKWLRPSNLILLAIEPLIILLLVWSNSAHHLFWTSVKLDVGGSFSVLVFARGVGAWVHVAYSYLLLLIGAFLIFETFIRSSYLYRRQAGVMLIALLAPWVGNAMFITGWNPFPHLDLTPFAFTITCGVCFWGLFHFRLLEIVPVARDAIIEGMSDAVIVLDIKDHIVDINPPAERLIDHSASEAIGQEAGQILPFLLKEPELACGKAEVNRAIVVGNHDRERTYDLSISHLDDSKGHLLGKAIVLRDITERKQAEEELKNSRQQLRNLTDHLEHLREQERTNIARDIHDELGQALTVLKMDTFWLTKHVPKNYEEILDKAKKMSGLIDATIQSVKKIATELRPGLLDDLGLASAIEWQAEEFQKSTGIKCELIVMISDISLGKDLSTAIFRIVQEALTNVARHAEATKVTVKLEEKDGQLVLTVRDNGIGITEDEISKAGKFGLVGIRERVLALGGEMRISGIHEKGTTMNVILPINE
jgi:PAS domain S-box-containing protein